MSELKIVVSVCMITYNHENYISEAIEGVLMQKTKFPIELIIGEDCSTDNTREICQEYQKKYPDKIKLLLPESNLGMMQNFYSTLNESTGKYIALCEGDDYWIDPNKLQKQVDFLEGNEEYGLIHSAYFSLNVETQIKDIKNYEHEATLESLLVGNSIATLTVCVRKSLIELYFKEIGVLNNGWLMGDYPMWIWVSTKTKIKFLPELTAVYRILNESASNSQNPIKNVLFEISVHEIREFFAIKENKLDLIKEQLSRFYLNTLHVFYTQSYFGKDVELLIRKLGVYAKVSCLNKIRLWGLGNKFNYSISKLLISIYKSF